jgi:hypothetical protein
MIDKLKTEFPKYEFNEDRYIGYWFFPHSKSSPNIVATPENFADATVDFILENKKDMELGHHSDIQ